MKPQVGQHAFIIESGHVVRPVLITKVTRDFCTVRFEDEGNGAIRVRANRLYFDEKDALFEADCYKEASAQYIREHGVFLDK